MPARIGYLLPTRENAMEGRHETAGLLRLAERAESLGLSSIWVGDSLTARPRHEPITLLAAVAARTRRAEIGTAVLLPALRNPVLFAHEAATLDRISEGRLILGIGIARDVPSIRAEFEAAGVPFEKRIGRLIEGMALARALWSGTPIDWSGRWSIKGATLAPTPHRPGGPPIWLAGALPVALVRVARHFDGWMPNGETPVQWQAKWQEVRRLAAAEGRDPARLTGAMYVTISVDEDVAAASQRLDAYLERYYGVPAPGLRARQTCYAGTAAGLAPWLASYVAAGVTHMIVRCVGDHERHLDLVAAARERLALA